MRERNNNIPREIPGMDVVRAKEILRKEYHMIPNIEDSNYINNSVLRQSDLCAYREALLFAIEYMTRAEKEKQKEEPVRSELTVTRKE